jgi:hypothetical protein
MSSTPSQQQQIIATHATLIVAIIQATQSGVIPPELEQGLQLTAKNGWTQLVKRIRKIVAGDRSENISQGLDDEDQTIINAILLGLQDPTTLPDPAARIDATMAAPGMAAMIHASRTGQPQALQTLATMSEQMASARGDMAKLGGIMKRLVDGERDADKLGRGMGAQGQSLLNSIIEELGKLEVH